MKTVDDAHRQRSMILGAFELAEAAESEEERTTSMTFAIVGAGPTGVELAGQVPELGQRILTSDYRSIDTSQARIVLLDSNQRVLKTFPEPLSARAEQACASWGSTSSSACARWGSTRRAWTSRWRWAFTLIGGSRRERLISIVSLVPETTARSVTLELRRRRAERLDQAGR